MLDGRHPDNKRRDIGMELKRLGVMGEEGRHRVWPVAKETSRLQAARYSHHGRNGTRLWKSRCTHL